MQVAHTEDKDDLDMSYVDLQMHWFVGVKPWGGDLLKGNDVDLNSHGTKLSRKTYNLFEFMKM